MRLHNDSEQEKSPDLNQRTLELFYIRRVQKTNASYKTNAYNATVVTEDTKQNVYENAKEF